MVAAGRVRRALIMVAVGVLEITAPSASQVLGFFHPEAGFGSAILKVPTYLSLPYMVRGHVGVNNLAAAMIHILQRIPGFVVFSWRPGISNTRSIEKSDRNVAHSPNVRILVHSQLANNNM